MLVPFTKGVTVLKTCSKIGSQLYFRGGNTIRNSWWPQRTRTPSHSKVEYICESRQMRSALRSLQGPLGKVKEHCRAFSLIYDHAHINQTSLDNYTILGRESCNIAWTIKEGISVRGNDPSLNRHTGKYQLLYIWDKVLFNTLDLKLK